MNYLINGLIKIDNDFIISPQTLKEEFLSSEVGKKSESLIENGKYCSYQTPSVMINGEKFHIDLYFESNLLTMVLLSMALDDVYDQLSYTEKFSESLLENHKKEHDKWVYKYVNHKLPFVQDWGTIDSVIDRKSWGCYIVMKYNVS